MNEHKELGNCLHTHCSLLYTELTHSHIYNNLYNNSLVVWACARVFMARTVLYLLWFFVCAFFLKRRQFGLIVLYALRTRLLSSSTIYWMNNDINSLVILKSAVVISGSFKNFWSTRHGSLQPMKECYFW